MKRNRNELLFTEETALARDRFFALIIDFLSFGLFFFFSTIILLLILLIIEDFFKEGLAEHYLDWLFKIYLSAYVIWFAFYYSQIYQRDAQSLGEKIMRIRMVPLDGGRISCCIAFHRLANLFMPIKWMGSIVLARNGRQSFLDVFCNTITIKDKK